MKYHALIVDDSPDVLDDVKDRIESLGHTCDCATCLQNAREHLDKNSYSYILLDLEIPVCYGRPSRIQNGQNLLREVHTTKGYEDMPIIVMTTHGHDSPDLAVEVLRCDGATDFVKKPFPNTGHTLEKAIHDALTATGRSRPGASKHSAAINHEPPQPFECGEMVFSEDRVELCEVKICGTPGSGMIRRILDQLKHKNSNGRYVRYGGAELAKRVECERGQNSITEAVREFRNSVCEVMLEEANVQMNRLRDIILNDRRYGYRLSSKITVRDAGAPPSVLCDPPNDLVNDPQKNPTPSNDETEYNKRQQWVLEQMRAGKPVRKVDIIDQFKCSKETAKRDLKALRCHGLVEFVGPYKTGHWRLTAIQ